jgi:hypothetical protein
VIKISLIHKVNQNQINQKEKSGGGKSRVDEEDS